MKRKTSTLLPSDEPVEKLVAGPKRSQKLVRPGPMDCLVDGHPCVKIFLTKGMFTIVDKQDEALVGDFNWTANPGNHGSVFYARRKRFVSEPGKGKSVMLHSMLLPNVPMIDHANGDGLDNRRCNLRPCDKSKNAGNQNVRKNSTTKFKGVGKLVQRGKCKPLWIARIGENGSRKYLGCFESPELAAEAYNRAALEKWGEFSKLNQIS